MKILFLNEPHNFVRNGEFVAMMPKVEGKDELLNNLADILRFPSYFGHTWDAVYDCLCDFHWLSEKGVILIHNELPVLNKENLRIYLGILIDASNKWRENDEHYFKLVFPEYSKALILEFLT